MILRGILDDALGQLCIRGFANISDLARISKANNTYQRKLIIEKQQSIHQYFNDSEHAFFPEIILSYAIKHDTTLSKQSKPLEEPLSALRKNKKYQSNVDNTSFAIKEQNFSLNFIRVVELNLPDEILISDKPFNRIDGNHRLSAVEFGKMDRFDSLVVPFCIVLQQEIIREKFDATTNRNIKITDSTDLKYEKLIFYNINAKSTPLTYEENLSAILSDEFSDDEVTKTIGLPAATVKRVKENIQTIITGYSGIKDIVSGSLSTICITLIKLLLKRESFTNKSAGEQIGLVKKAFEKINTIYNENERIKSNPNIELLVAFLYYASLEINHSRIKQFELWVCNNDLFDVVDTKANDFINIFDKIFEHNIKIFVAMPYFNGDSNTVANYNRIYHEAIEAVKNEFTYQNIILFKIMEYSGATTNILDSIFNQIRECSIFIADITESNANVFCEYGYAKALNKDIIIFRRSDDNSKIPFDVDKYNRYSYSTDNSLKDHIIEHVSDILIKNYGLIKESK